MLNQYSRYFFRPKILLSYFTHFSLMITLYTTLKNWYSSIYIEDIENNYKYNFFNLIAPFGLIVLILVNAFYIKLYYFEFPYFEKMRSNNLPWPWKENSQKFWRELPAMIKAYLRNDFILFPIGLCLVLKVFKVRYDLDSIPNFTKFWLTI